MANYLFNASEIKASKALVKLMSTIKDINNVTDTQAKSLTINVNVIHPMPNSVLMDNFMFNPIFKGLFTVNQIVELMNFQKLHKAKKESTVYSRSYFKIHYNHRNTIKARQRYKRAYNEVKGETIEGELQPLVVYMTDWIYS